MTTAEDFYGYLRFFDGPGWTGESYYYYTSDSQYCINLSCFDERTSSVFWKGMPNEGTADGLKTSTIAFFDDWNCTGKRLEFLNANTDRENMCDIATYSPGHDNKISSFIIYEDSRKSKGNVLPCPRNFDLF